MDQLLIAFTVQYACNKLAFRGSKESLKGKADDNSHRRNRNLSLVYVDRLDQLHRSSHLCGAAVEVSSGGADAAVPCQGFQNMDRSAFVGQTG